MCNEPREEDRCGTGRFTEPIWATQPSTVGMSGIDIYLSDAIPEWKGSLLVTALRGTALFRLTLSADGRAVTGSERLYQSQFGRLRDVLVGPDGAVYLATSNLDGRGQPRAGDDRIIRLKK
jgi:glucose/arabinose dehydrogenase